MNKLLVLVLLLFCFVSVGQAKTVKLSQFSTPNDGLDDSPGFQAAQQALKETGGTLIVDGGVWDFKQTVRWVDYGNYVSYNIVGDEGAVINVDADYSYGFYIGNVNHITFSNLIFLGDVNNTANDVTYDTTYLIFANYVHRVVVNNCEFYGIRARQSLIAGWNIDLVVQNSEFGGSIGDAGAVHHVSTFNSLSVSRTHFYDYGNYKNGYYSKVGGGGWVVAENPSVASKAANSPAISISDSRFDEGTVPIILKNIPLVSINNCGFNISAVSSTFGILFDNVGYAKINNATFGWSTNPRPALKVMNSSTVQADGVILNHGVYLADVDASSKLTVTNCPSCAPKTLKRSRQPILRSEASKQK